MQRRHGRVEGQRTDEGVLTGTGADDEDLHGRRAYRAARPCRPPVRRPVADPRAAGTGRPSRPPAPRDPRGLDTDMGAVRTLGTAPVSV
ncbi:hypothetical protein CTKZ_30740 [Cellulomonas algicola]|uniref:Uncharacterized protein n=1 Tax=Cellulomonas algicola TaxID=2071633 RepID=A0A401V3N1_9CELL|nr:hypothetical protein CTKZ_30740 [Cellulomonas algicola]